MRIPLSLIALAALATTPAALADDTPLLPANQSWRIQLGEGMCELRLGELLDQGDGRWMGEGVYDCDDGQDMISWGITLVDGRAEVTLSGNPDVFYGEGCDEGWPDWPVGQQADSVCWLNRDVGTGVMMYVQRTQ